MLNIEANTSPQLTSKTPVDYPTTTNIIPENTKKVNTSDEKIKALKLNGQVTLTINT